MKLTQSQLRNFIGSWLIPKPKPEPETVETFARKMNRENNHEIWRSCNSCGNQWDAITDGYFICPKCGSTDLISGKAL